MARLAVGSGFNPAYNQRYFTELVAHQVAVTDRGAIRPLPPDPAFRITVVGARLVAGRVIVNH